LLVLQAVDQRVNEGREVVVGWEDVWMGMKVLSDALGCPVYNFVASNVAVSRNHDEVYIAVD